MSLVDVVASKDGSSVVVPADPTQILCCCEVMRRLGVPILRTPNSFIGRMAARPKLCMVQI